MIQTGAKANIVSMAFDLAPEKRIR